MTKITKKLFSYFTLLLIFFAFTAFIGFCGVFRHYTYQRHENDLKTRASSIKNQLEQFMTPGSGAGQGPGRGQGRGAYLRFINDIAMADAYIIDVNGQPFSYGNHGTAGNLPTKEVLDFASHIFTGGTYTCHRQTDVDGKEIILVGMPVQQEGQTVLAIIIRDTAHMDKYSLLLAISTLGGCLLLALFLSGALSVFLSRRFIRPIQQIAAVTKELTRENYLAKTNVHDNTELGELAEEMDQLAQKLETARQESEQMEQMQKNYISNISHELRTPVTVIRSSLEAICEGVVTGTKAVEYQRQMLTECISLQRLVNDMLELSRLQNNDFPIEKQSMDLLLALEDAVRAVRVIAREKDVHIQYDKGQEEWLLEGDYGRLRQMFIAALDNAIKYSPAQTQIQISASIYPDTAEIAVKDHGCGIPPEDLTHIFARFYRPAQNREKGSGLGLAIIKSIADRHNIDVDIQSALQKGTCITFRISKTDIQIYSYQP